jgi:hypothetical protein
MLGLVQWRLRFAVVGVLEAGREQRDHNVISVIGKGNELQFLGRNLAAPPNPHGNLPAMAW